MEKRAIFGNTSLPYAAARAAARHHARLLLLAGEPGGVAVVPAAGRVRAPTDFVWFENYRELFATADYYRAIATTRVFSVLVAVLSLSIALLLAVQADKQHQGRRRLQDAADLALCGGAGRRRRAVALHVPALARPGGARPARARHRLEPAAQRQPRHDHWSCSPPTWKQISYNFLFFLAGLQSIPRSVIEAAAIDGARPMRRFWTIIFPLLSPTTFFLLVVNIVYVFFDTFGIIDAMTGGGPAKATETLVYKVYADGRLGGDLGGSAAQSVILMVIVIALTAIQFRYVERKVTY